VDDAWRQIAIALTMLGPGHFVRGRQTESNRL